MFCEKIKFSVLVLGLIYQGVVYAEEGSSSLTKLNRVADILSQGEVDFSFRYRFEYVDNPTTPLDAFASSLRTFLGYRTATFHGFGLYGQVENILVLGNEFFNDGGSNGITDRPTVVDPEGTEINQYYLYYEGTESLPILDRTSFRLGRQVLTYRAAPFQRFIGNVGFRQNWQSFDGYTLENESIEDTRLSFAYLYNINRIFGEDNPTPGLADQGLDGFLFNVQYEGLQLADVELYSYLLDFDEDAAPLVAAGFYQSTLTAGARFTGHTLPIHPKADLFYAFEGAYQKDYAQNPNEISSFYVFSEFGTKLKLGGFVDELTLKFNYELLSGKGGANRFTTPLATLHPFQGWADQFLNTPVDGVEDIYFTLNTKIFSSDFTFVYHDFNSDNDNYDFGRELNLALTKNISDKFKVGLIYAYYDADQNATNLARNPIQSEDITRFWTFFTFAL